MVPIAARNTSPPSHAATATPPNSTARTAAIAARPIRSIKGREPDVPLSRSGRTPSVHQSRRLEVQGHQVAADRRGDLSPTPGLLDDDGDGDRRRLRRGEPDEPGVWLAATAELGRARLARGRDTRHLCSGGELPAQVALHGRDHRPVDGRSVRSASRTWARVCAPI